MSYEVNGALKFWEEDVYGNGCIGNGGSTWIDIRWRADTLAELVEKLNSFAGNDDPGAVLYDACEEEGRIDIQVLETYESNAPTEADLAAWKEGKRRLWLCDYSFKVERVERQAVNLTNELQGA